CKQDEFLCGNGRCISTQFRCDGTDDCGNGRDETDCQNCTAGFFHCLFSGTCLPTSKLCDGSADCPDGTDESGPGCGPPRQPPATCHNSEFRCESGECVLQSWRCDHSPDCVDGSDEKDCDRNECLEDNGGCSYLCVDEPLGFVCDCPSGMRLVRDTDCEEIDECLDADLCSQLCVHLNGTYRCKCHPGYLKNPSTEDCSAAGEEALVVFSSSVGVRRINSGSHEYRGIVAGVLEPGPLALDIPNRTVYLGSRKQGAIYRMSLDKTSQEPVQVLSGIDAPVGLAVDWVHGLLYWTDARTRSVNVALLDGAKRHLLIGGLSQPMGVAVQPLLGLLFWSDVGRPARIEQAGMDGRNRVALVTSAIQRPVAITLDMPRSLLYWVDSGLRTVSRIGLDGQHRKIVVESNGFLDRPFGLAVFEDQVFWADQDTRAIYRANKRSGANVRIMLNNTGSMWGLVLAHPVLQPEGTSVLSVDTDMGDRHTLLIKSH
ncbi:VLDLR protein, partial [Amia calva]|nr:VLDLR protein [Amia calva]